MALRLVGRVWTGEDEGDGDLVVDGPDETVRAAWVGQGIVDAHVHAAFGDPLVGAVVAARDLGGPEHIWRVRRPGLQVAGPVLTAPTGYPSRTWGADGFAAFLEEPAQARALVEDLPVDVVKVALEPAGGQPVPPLPVVQAVVEAAHARGLRVTAHALSAPMVERALDAGVDELAHVPFGRLPDELVARLVDVPVVSTLQTHADAGALECARQLVEAGVRLVHGTDLGNAGTRPGADPGELQRLAEAGLGAEGALRAATVDAAALLGLSSPGWAALDADPRQDPTAWTRPLRVVRLP